MVREKESSKKDKTEDIDSLVQRKILLLRRYLALTEELGNGLQREQSQSFIPLLVRRQKCAEEVDRTDALLRRAAHQRTGRASMGPYLSQLQTVLSRIEDLDRQLMGQMRQETETLREDLLKRRFHRKAAEKYRGPGGQERARFLDVNR